MAALLLAPAESWGGLQPPLPPPLYGVLYEECMDTAEGWGALQVPRALWALLGAFGPRNS